MQEIDVKAVATHVLWATFALSTLFGAKLMINGNDDVASENDAPFSNLQITIPASVRKAFPEAPGDDKGRVLNPIVLEKIGQFHDGYLQELRAAVM